MTTDITSRYLEAALLDQKVAGTFTGQRYAFVPVYQDENWALGVAVEKEDGYNPIKGKTFVTREAAQEWADGLNKHIGLTPLEAIDIITSTMQGGGRPNLNKWD